MKSTHPKYGIHPGVEMMVKWVEELPAKTGRSVEQWMAVARKEGPKDVAALREWFKTKHGHGANSARWLADRATGASSGEADTPAGYLRHAAAWVDAMYSGGKAGLRPIHDALIELGLSLGPDVKFCPCETIVPLYRHHVIAQIKPSTRTRIDFGLALGDVQAVGRLKDTGGFAKKDRITHRFEITSLSEITPEVRRWLKVAHDRDK